MHIQTPFYPIIYVRGFAMTQGEIDATTATPYMGFNLGSTRLRQLWDGSVQRHYFESPLIRLMKEYGYADAYLDGHLRSEGLPARSIFIHRYYDVADRQLGEGKRPSILEAARDLAGLIGMVRRAICGDDQSALRDFRVNLVAHSMGGLICRALLQNKGLRDSEEARQVNKVFTYATPHNGIELAGFNVPRFLGVWDINNFNRREMSKYLSLDDHRHVATLAGHFDPARFFCLIGTNARDYGAAAGMSSRLAGEMSDGLVRIDNAAVNGAPRAFVHRSHSGPFGIVNSEEGYQNLVRFMFGDLRVDGHLELDHLPLPPSVQRAKDGGKKVKASYWFEASVSPRPALEDGNVFYLTERRKANFSAVMRGYDEMMKPAKAGRADPRWPFLFSAFLDTSKITRGKTMVFTVELVISATDYVLDGILFFDRTIPGENLYRQNICVRATRTDEGWRVRCNLVDDEWGEKLGRELELSDGRYVLPIKSAKGLAGSLMLSIKPHEHQPSDE
ncbi:MAG: hypothetical protein JJU31_10590 [Wenzhouxiangella sp.]|nr:hypothetical protein [Wenzhouxiangella sp.]MCH8477914.1 hypothetical protein [Wenzhouxiangella sp.]